MPTPHDPEVTTLLARVRQGEPDAVDEVIAATYPELRKVARAMMRNERAGHTLQATAVVHEAYLRLFHGQPADLTSRNAFFAVMAGQMKRLLIDHARRRGALKRGGDFVRADFDGFDPAAPTSNDAEAFFASLDEALAALAEEHPRVAKIIERRFFGDLSIEETAAELGLGTGTVKRDFAFGRAWLAGRLKAALPD